MQTVNRGDSPHPAGHPEETTGTLCKQSTVAIVPTLPGTLRKPPEPYANSQPWR